MTKKSNRGGTREGAGAPPKDPAAGPRIMWAGRLHQDTIRKLKKSAKPGLSQSEIIDQAVSQWSAARNRASR